MKMNLDGISTLTAGFKAYLSTLARSFTTPLPKTGQRLNSFEEHEVLPKSLPQAKEQVNQLVDGLNKPIDEGIKRVVAALRLVGFHTTASCEGHMNWGLPYPWVQVNNDREFTLRDTAEQQAMRALVDECFKGRFFPPVQVTPMGIYGGFRLMPYASITEDGYKDEKLREFHLHGMNQFADWLLQRHENLQSNNALQQAGSQ
jgi:hypothetical protein